MDAAQESLLSSNIRPLSTTSHLSILLHSGTISSFHLVHTPMPGPSAYYAKHQNIVIICGHLEYVGRYSRQSHLVQLDIFTIYYLSVMEYIRWSFTDNSYQFHISNYIHKHVYFGHILFIGSASDSICGAAPWCKIYGWTFGPCYTV